MFSATVQLSAVNPFGDERYRDRLSARSDVFIEGRLITVPVRMFQNNPFDDE